MQIKIFKTILEQCECALKEGKKTDQVVKAHTGRDKDGKRTYNVDIYDKEEYQKKYCLK